MTRKKPNVVLILNDDMGYSDLGCYGGEIDTPNLDRLARDGLRFSQFYNTARCSPSRASMLTGLHPQTLRTYDRMGLVSPGRTTGRGRRYSLRDIEMRVLFQMSATDSSNLMDSPAASKLGVHRAMFYSEEQGQAEKFRPYGPPSADWLQWVQKQLGRSTNP